MRPRPAQNSLTPPRSYRQICAAAGIGLLAFWVYWPALTGGVLWDDPAHLTRVGLRSWDGLRRIWFEVGATQEYYPVLHSAFWLEHRLWGDAVLPYHLTNVFLHAANCGLLACLLRRLWSQPVAGSQPPAAGGASLVPAGTAWFAAALFAVHPVCVESVAWITEQKNTLSTACYLLSALCYLDFAARRRAWSYALAFGLFLLALGAKTMTVTLPAGLLVVLWWQQGRLAWRRDVLPLLPWFAVAIAAGLLTAQVESNWVGAETVVTELPFLQRGLLAARIFWFSLGHLLWPAGLTFFYPQWDVATESAGWLVHVIAGLAVTAVLWMYRGRSRGPLAVWLLYAGTLFPVLGFFKVFSFSFSYVADHFQYLAIPAVMAAVAAGLSLAFKRIPHLPRRSGPVLAGVVVLLLGLCSRGHSRLYLDDQTLFQANIAANPGSWMGHHILATTAARSPERRVEAIALYRQSLQLKTDNPDSLAALAALLVKEPGHSEEATGLFQEAVRLRPAFAEAHNGLANELAAIPGRLPEAIEHYQEALRLRPLFGLARANLAQALAQIPGHEAEAIECFAEVLRVMPDYAPAHFHLASLLVSQPGQLPEAVLHYEAVLRLRPDSVEALDQLGLVLARLGRPEEARACWNRALQVRPDFEPAQRNLRMLDIGGGR